MDEKKRINTILRLLKKEYPVTGCALHHKTPFQLLVATILSAQCTDKRVNLVTKELFKKYCTINSFANANISELEQDIKSTGFYRNKAKNIKKCAQQIIEKFNSKVPRTIEELTQLAGVGRKTANVVLGNAFNTAVGVVVDTHVIRITQLLELTEHKNPEKIEQDLMKILPKKEWIDFSHRIITHGRKVCIARRPNCKDCVLNPACPNSKLKKL